MLINFGSMLSKAYAERYAVGSFNVYNYETMKGVAMAAREEGCESVIVAFGAKYLTNMTLDEAGAMAGSVSRAVGIPLCLHLDHCPDLNTIYAAIREGFTSVMYDGSSLPFEENARNTALVCGIAHACGVTVEAELGSLAAGEHSHEGAESDRQEYTSPDDAAEFARFTGVDALAVSIGTVHGMYKGEPNVRVDILKDINQAVGIPLVLHGGSGTPESAIRECIQNGIAKINVNTEISAEAVKRTLELLQNGKPPHLSVLSLAQQGFVRDVVRKYIRFFR